MREPGFWHRPSSVGSLLLLPLGALYGAGAGGAAGRGGGAARWLGGRRVGGVGGRGWVLDGGGFTKSRDRKGGLADGDRGRRGPGNGLCFSRRSLARPAAAATCPH